MIKWDDVIVTGNRTCFSWTYTDPDDKLWNWGGGGMPHVHGATSPRPSETLIVVFSTAVN
jgi:hypothetical protein